MEYAFGKIKKSPGNVISKIFQLIIQDRTFNNDFLKNDKQVIIYSSLAAANLN